MKKYEFPLSLEKRLDDAIRRFDSDIHDTECVKKFIDLVNEGCNEAFYYIGLIYESGSNGVMCDLEKAIFYYQKSIETSGYVESYLSLARIYYHGLSGKSDRKKSLEYYSKVYESTGNPIAAIMLGKIYMDGELVDRDIDRARSLFDQSIEEGYIYAYQNKAILEWRERNFVRATAVFFLLMIKMIRLSRTKNDSGLHDRRWRKG